MGWIADNAISARLKFCGGSQQGKALDQRFVANVVAFYTHSCQHFARLKENFVNGSFYIDKQTGVTVLGERFVNAGLTNDVVGG